MESQGLLKLAKERFADDWSDADEKLFEATAKGVVAHYGDGDPAEAAKWGSDRVLKANRIEWLCTDREAVKHVTFRGVQIVGARIDDELSLPNAVVAFPLAIVRCSITGGVTFARAHLHLLFLSGSHCGPIFADGLRVDHDLCMNDGFRADGEVRLLGAKIATLDCGSGVFDRSDGYALNADGIEVMGSIFLNNKFRSTGEVSLCGAKIGATLDCCNGVFNGADGCAFNMDGIEVAGSVFLSNEFSATGEVSLLGAVIGGIFGCRGGRFGNPTGYAINADRMVVKGSVFFDEGFSATGEVRLLGAKIGSDLSCENCTFKNPTGNALSADGIDVNGSVFLRGTFRATGCIVFVAARIRSSFQWLSVLDSAQCMLDLRSARVGTLWDEEKSWPAELGLDGFVYDRIFNDAPINAGLRLEWLKRQVHYNKRFAPQPYAQLAKVLQEMGHEVDARRILIAKQEDPARVRGLSWTRWVWHQVLKWTIRYGYLPGRAVWWMLGFFAMGIFVFHGGYDSGAFLQTHVGDVPAFSAIVYSIDSFVPLIDLQQTKYWFPKSGWTQIYLWVHTGFGWALSTLLVVGLTRLVRK